MIIPDQVIARFWSYVDKAGAGDCWIFKSYLDQCRYGKFYWAQHGTHMGAHRVSWHIANGDIPPGMFVLHKCDNPTCVNPAHLFLGNQSDNMLDCYRKGRANSATRNAAISRALAARFAERKTCKYGHDWKKNAVPVITRGKRYLTCNECRNVAGRKAYKLANPVRRPHKPYLYPRNVNFRCEYWL